MTSYHNYASRSAYLEALRQEHLEAAEFYEHRGDADEAAWFRRNAAQFMEQIRREQARAKSS